LAPAVLMVALAPVVEIPPLDVTLDAPTAAKFDPPVASRRASVLAVAAVAPAVAPLTAVPFAVIKPVRFDVVEVVTVFGPAAPVAPVAPVGPRDPASTL